MLRSSLPARSLLVLLLLCGCPKTGEGPTPSVDTTAAPTGVASKPHVGLDLSDAAGKLERLTTSPGDELYPAPNRDGSLVLFQEEKYEGPEKKLVSQLLYGIKPAAPSKRELYSTEGRASSHASFAPDGSGYVFITNTLGPLALVRTESPAPNAALRAIVSSDLAPAAAEPTVSPDGSRVAFSMNDKVGARSVAVINVGGEKQTLVGEGRSPAWSPDGRYLFFVRTTNGFNHIFRVDANGFGALTQVTQGNMDCDRPSLSPSGKHIVFASNFGYEDLHRQRSEVLHIWAARADGTALTELTQGTARSATPSWGRDGWIYFSSDREGSFDVYRLKPSGDLAAP